MASYLGFVWWVSIEPHLIDLSLRGHLLQSTKVSLLCLPQAQLVDLKSELTDAQAEKVVVEKEVHEQLLQLHALQLQLHARAGQTVDSSSIKDRMVCTFIQLTLHLFGLALALYTCLRSLLGLALNSRSLLSFLVALHLYFSTCQRLLHFNQLLQTL